MERVLASPNWTLLTCYVGNTLDVDKRARKTLAANLDAVISASGLTRTGWATSKRLDVKAVERVTKELHAPRLDFLEELAVAAGMETWQLLHPQGRAASEEPNLSPDALRIARQLDAIKDPTNRANALAICDTATLSLAAAPRGAQIHEHDEEPEVQPQARPQPAPTQKTRT